MTESLYNRTVFIMEESYMDLTQISDDELVALYRQTENQAVAKGTLQLALKVLANSL